MSKILLLEREYIKSDGKTRQVYIIKAVSQIKSNFNISAVMPN